MIARREQAATGGSSSGTAPARGSVLVLALWTLFFLSALALAVAAYVGGGIGLASAMKADRAGYFAAKAGVGQAIAVIVADTNNWDALTEDWSGSEEYFSDVAMAAVRGAPSAAGRFTASWFEERDDGKRRERYGLSDEESRINLNKRSDSAVLRALLQRVGRVDAVKARRIADAIIDWRDADDLQLTDGAENSYYQALPTAYECGNGPLKSAEELLLVREVGPDLFVRLEPYITVYGSGKVNINTAGPTVLATLGDAVTGERNPASDSLAAGIVAFRDRGNVFEKADEVGIVRRLQRAGGLADAEVGLLRGIMRYLSVGSTCFRGVITGTPGSMAAGGGADGGPSGERTVTFVFDRTERARLMWRED